MEDITVYLEMHAKIEPLDVRVEPFQCKFGCNTRFDVVAELKIINLC